MLPFYNPKLTNRIEICFNAMFAIERKYQRIDCG